MGPNRNLQRGRREECQNDHSMADEKQRIMCVHFRSLNHSCPLLTGATDPLGERERRMEADTAYQVTLYPLTGEQLFDQGLPRTVIERLIPDTLRAPPPISRHHQVISDDYLKRGSDSAEMTEEDRIRDLLMPLYLGEELSPRFSHWKENKAFPSAPIDLPSTETDIQARCSKGMDGRWSRSRLARGDEYFRGGSHRCTFEASDGAGSNAGRGYRVRCDFAEGSEAESVGDQSGQSVELRRGEVGGYG